LAVVDKAQHLIDYRAHVLGLTAVEQREDTGRTERDAIQRLSDAVVQFARKTVALVMHGHGNLGGSAGALDDRAFARSSLATLGVRVETAGDSPHRCD